MMDRGQMETPSQKQAGPLDYMSEGKNILSWLLESSGPLILIHISKGNCISVREEVLNTAKDKNCGENSTLLLCLMLLFQMSCLEK